MKEGSTKETSSRGTFRGFAGALTLTLGVLSGLMGVAWSLRPLVFEAIPALDWLGPAAVVFLIFIVLRLWKEQFMDILDTNYRHTIGPLVHEFAVKSGRIRVLAHLTLAFAAGCVIAVASEITLPAIVLYLNVLSLQVWGRIRNPGRRGLPVLATHLAALVSLGAVMYANMIEAGSAFRFFFYCSQAAAIGTVSGLNRRPSA